MDNQNDFEKRYEDIRQQAGRASDSARLHELFDVAWQQNMFDNPEWATAIGHPGHDHRWTDKSFDAIERRKQLLREQLKTLQSIDRSGLSHDDQLSYDLFERDLVDDIETGRFPHELLAVNQMGGVQQDVPRVLEMMPTNTAAQCQDILARLRAVPVLVDQTIALLPMLAVLKKIASTVSAEEQAQVQQEAYGIYSNDVVPALQRLHDFLVNTYLPGCRESVAWSELPGGEEWYAFLVRRYTTTSLTPDDIFAIGQAEVKRIRRQMEKIIRQTGFDGDFAAFCEFLRTDKQFFFNDAGDLLRGYRDIAKRVDPELIRLFGRLPRLPYGVIAVPSYAEKSQTTAYYESGSLEAGRPGYYYVNTYDLESRPKWEMEALTLHEAVPGHHLQIALAQELADVPEFRKHGWVTAYGEGWALYAESLGEEMGLYRDPYSRFGQSTYEIWRAIRLVVDVGIHAKGWSRQQAIDFFRENSSKTEHDIEVEIDRYIVWPAQSLAYKIGELKIRELRAYAAEQLGESFDIRALHDELLGQGGLPLEILEAQIRGWVHRQVSERP
jgi:uncharacterized protein (DUF885 family)